MHIFSETPSILDHLDFQFSFKTLAVTYLPQNMIFIYAFTSTLLLHALASPFCWN